MASKKKRSYSIFNVSPQNLMFYAPYNRIQNRLITILNPTATRLLFKIRCNYSQKYKVSPNCGWIEPYDTTEVTISLNHFDFQNDPTYQHRFCVQCIQAYQYMDSFDSQSILNYFKETPSFAISNMRIPVELQPEVCTVPQSELEAEFQESLENIQPLDFNFMQQFKQLTVQLAKPALQKKHCNFGQTFKRFLIFFTGFLGGNLSNSYHSHYVFYFFNNYLVIFYSLSASPAGWEHPTVWIYATKHYRATDNTRWTIK